MRLSHIFLITAALAFADVPTHITTMTMSTSTNMLKPMNMNTTMNMNMSTSTNMPKDMNMNTAMNTEQRDMSTPETSMPANTKTHPA